MTDGLLKSYLIHVPSKFQSEVYIPRHSRLVQIVNRFLPGGIYMIESHKIVWDVC